MPVDLNAIDYSALDRLDVTAYLFHPRPDYEKASAGDQVLIPVGKGVAVGAKLHLSAQAGPNILFFHGNGEIASDYDDFAEIYSKLGMNFIPVDYRGYGKSSGNPTITGMMRDSHAVYGYVRTLLRERKYSGPFIAMGRSLGSASALELLAAYGDKIDGVVIESGFARTQTLFDLLGLDMKAFGLTEEDGFRNLDKIMTFGKPTLIIHAEQDHILPFSEGEALFEASPAAEKTFLKIPGANHNDILMRGLREYMKAVKELTEKALRSRDGAQRSK